MASPQQRSTALSPQQVLMMRAAQAAQIQANGGSLTPQQQQQLLILRAAANQAREHHAASGLSTPARGNSLAPTSRGNAVATPSGLPLASPPPGTPPPDGASTEGGGDDEAKLRKDNGALKFRIASLEQALKEQLAQSETKMQAAIARMDAQYKETALAREEEIKTLKETSSTASEQIETLKSDLARIRTECEEARTSAAARSSEIASLDQDLSRVRAELAASRKEASEAAQLGAEAVALRQTLTSMHAELDTARREVATVNAEIALQRATVESKNVEVSTLTQQLDATKREAATLTTDLATARSEATTAAAEVTHLTAQLAAVTSTAEAKTKQVETLEAALEERRKDAGEASQVLADTKAKLEQTARELDQAHAQVTSAQSLAEYRQRDLEAMSKQLEGMKKELEAAHDKVTELNGVLRVREGEIVASDTKARDAQEQLTNHAAKVGSLETSLEEARSKHRAVAGELETAQRELATTREQRHVLETRVQQLESMQTQDKSTLEERVRELSEFKAQLLERDSALQKLQHDLSAEQFNVERLNKDKAALEIKAKEDRAAFDAQSKSMESSYEERIRDAQKHADEKTEELGVVRGQLKQMTQKSEEQARSIESLTAQKESVEKKLTADTAEFEARLASLQSQVDAKGKEGTELRLKVDELAAGVAERDTAIAQHVATIKRLEETRERLEHRLEELTKAHEALARQCEEQKLAMSDYTTRAETAEASEKAMQVRMETNDKEAATLRQQTAEAVGAMDSLKTRVDEAEAARAGKERELEAVQSELHTLREMHELLKAESVATQQRATQAAEDLTESKRVHQELVVKYSSEHESWTATDEAQKRKIEQLEKDNGEMKIRIPELEQQLAAERREHAVRMETAQMQHEEAMSTKEREAGTVKADLEARLAASERDLGAEKHKVMTLTHERDELLLIRGRHEIELTQLRTKLPEAETSMREAAETKREMEKVRARNRHMTNEVDTLRLSKTALETEVSGMHLRIKNLQDQLDKARLENAQIYTKQKLAQSSAGKHKDLESEYKAKLLAAEDRVRKLDADKGAALAELDKWKEECLVLRREVDKSGKQAEKRVLTVRQGANEVQRKAVASERALDEAKGEISMLKEMVKSLRNQMTRKGRPPPDASTSELIGAFDKLYSLRLSQVSTPPPRTPQTKLPPLTGGTQRMFDMENMHIPLGASVDVSMLSPQQRQQLPPLSHPPGSSHGHRSGGAAEVMGTSGLLRGSVESLHHLQHHGASHLSNNNSLSPLTSSLQGMPGKELDPAAMEALFANFGGMGGLSMDGFDPASLAELDEETAAALLAASEGQFGDDLNLALAGVDMNSLSGLPDGVSAEGDEASSRALEHNRNHNPSSSFRPLTEMTISASGEENKVPSMRLGHSARPSIDPLVGLPDVAPSHDDAFSSLPTHLELASSNLVEQDSLERANSSTVMMTMTEPDGRNATVLAFTNSGASSPDPVAEASGKALLSHPSVDIRGSTAMAVALDSQAASRLSMHSEEREQWEEEEQEGPVDAALSEVAPSTYPPGMTPEQVARMVSLDNHLEDIHSSIKVATPEGDADDPLADVASHAGELPVLPLDGVRTAPEELLEEAVAEAAPNDDEVYNDEEEDGEFALEGDAVETLP